MAKPVTYYSKTLARQIITHYAPLGLVEAYMGMHEDWAWTAQPVWNEGTYSHEGFHLDGDRIELGGIDGSQWATPVIELIFNDGSTKKYRCYIGARPSNATERMEKSLLWASGCISGPTQQDRTESELLTFQLN